MLGQTTHVVMTLDRGRRSNYRHTFNHVGIKRSLRKEIEDSNTFRRIFKYINKYLSYCFTFLLWIRNTRQSIYKPLRGVLINNR